MKLFLCSHFSSVGSLIKEEIENKKVAFIPTASLREGYTGYVGSARKLFKKLGAIVTEIDISTEAYSTIQSVWSGAPRKPKYYLVTVRAMEKKGIRTEKGEFNRWIRATNAVIRDIKKKIALLFDWIAEAKAELAKPQAPDLAQIPSSMDVLIWLYTYSPHSNKWEFCTDTCMKKACIYPYHKMHLFATTFLFAFLS